MRGQSAVNYLIIVMLLLVLVVPFSIMGMMVFSESSKDLKYKHSMELLVSAVDDVYTAGGGYREVYVSFPDGLEEVFLDDRSIGFRYMTSEGMKDIVGRTRGEVNGTMTKESGTHKVVVYYFQGDLVQIKG